MQNFPRNLQSVNLKTLACWLSCWSLLLATAIAPPSLAQTVTTTTGETLVLDQVWEKLVQAQVVYLGETHDSKADHAAQLAIIQALYQRNPQLVIGMEMFQRPYQQAIEDYLADRIDEAELLKRTEYEKRWGFDWELYAPIVRFAKANKLPIVALNTPAEVTRKTSRQGLASLNLNDKRFIPPISAIQAGVTTSAAGYRQMLQEVFEQVHQGKGGAARFERFFTAQVLWDETMADRIAQLLRRGDRPVIVLAGQGHIVYGYGIPSRVQRRIPTVKQQTVLLNPDPDQRDKAAIADLLWSSGEAQKERGDNIAPSLQN
jgi:uncharacterized iron-regulated protein